MPNSESASGGGPQPPPSPDWAKSCEVETQEIRTATAMTLGRIPHLQRGRVCGGNDSPLRENRSRLSIPPVASTAELPASPEEESRGGPRRHPWPEQAALRRR